MALSFYAMHVAVLKDRENRRQLILAARSLLGRAETCNVRLTSRHISGEHVVIFWDGVCWAVRDLGSTNGTFVDGTRVVAGQCIPLEPGTTLAFGDPAERWVLEDAGPPTACARALGSGEVRAAERGLLALPNARDPVATLFEDRYGRWMLEIDGVVRPAVDHECIDIGAPWILEIPAVLSNTGIPRVGVELVSEGEEPMLVSATVLRFAVSLDQEYVALSLIRGGREVRLGGRAHHELFLALARARLRDRDAGVPEREQGWLYVDELRARLGLELQRLNVYAYRGRKQLARAGVLDAGALVERRSTTRQIRLGTGRVEIVAA